MDSGRITGGTASPQRQDYTAKDASSASGRQESRSVYEMMRDAREQAEARQDQFRQSKNTSYGDAPMMAYAKLARARTAGEVTAASGFARRKILQLQSAIRSDPDNKERIQAAIR